MRSRRLAWIVAALLPAFGLAAGPTAAPDPLAGEIARWTSYVRSNPSSDETWKQIRQATEPALAQADESLRAGRRLHALLRLAAAHGYLAAWTYVEERGGAKPGAEKAAVPPTGQEAAFEVEWARMGKELARDLATPSPSAAAGVAQAALRAVAEGALPQVRAYYESSLEYGRATMPQFGYLYLGQARAEKELVALCWSLSASAPASLRAPSVRAIDAELDALEAEVLAAYRPPLSIDKHPEFIGVGSALKEARELNALGLHHGALLRYLQAALRFAPLRPGSPPPDADAAARLADFDARLGTTGVDHSIGRLFIEVGESELAARSASSQGTASAVVSDILPRYLAALVPAPKVSPLPPAEVTVTLVRWPYT